MNKQSEHDNRAGSFTGYPYIVTELMSSIHHIALLPNVLSADELVGLAAMQASANKLPLCLVFSPDIGIYFDTLGTGTASDVIPKGLVVVSGNLKLSADIPEDRDIYVRKKMLIAYQKMINGNDLKIVTGNLNKGGRIASAAELKQLARSQLEGVPIGLIHCNICNEWKGECMDTSRLLVDIICKCQNDNFCAWCKGPLFHHKLNSNYYEDLSHSVWHAPGICCLDHMCTNET